jgi:DNA-binding transcriptional LysR family regulator
VYIKKFGRPAHPSELANHQCIQVRDALSGEPLQDWEYRQGRKVVSVKTAGRIVVTEFGPVIGACLAGAGIARVKAVGVQDLLASGQLIDVLPNWPGQSFPLYALYPAGPYPTAKVRAFIDFVVERVGRHNLG